MLTSIKDMTADEVYNYLSRSLPREYDYWRELIEYMNVKLRELEKERLHGRE